MTNNPCNCGSTDLTRFKPYNLDTVRCNECHVHLREKDWNRIMCRSEYHGVLADLAGVADSIDDNTAIDTPIELTYTLDIAKFTISRSRKK